MGVLSPSDLGGAAKGGTSSRGSVNRRSVASSSGRRSQRKKYNIAMDDDMPEGAIIGNDNDISNKGYV